MLAERFSFIIAAAPKNDITHQFGNWVIDPIVRALSKMYIFQNASINVVK